MIAPLDFRRLPHPRRERKIVLAGAGVGNHDAGRRFFIRAGQRRAAFTSILRSSSSNRSINALDWVISISERCLHWATNSRAARARSRKKRTLLILSSFTIHILPQRYTPSQAPKDARVCAGSYRFNCNSTGRNGIITSLRTFPPKWHDGLLRREMRPNADSRKTRAKCNQEKQGIGTPG